VSSLASLQVLVLDCQATGASPAFGHVLELGWGVVRPPQASEVVLNDVLDHAEAHWIALPEGHRVPAQVRKLTGYDPAAAEPALAAEEAWRRLRAALPGPPITPMSTPTVIHFARFELAFLRAWSTRFEPGEPFPLDVVCLHDMANRLLPELPRLSLRALAGYCGYSLHLARRSLGHIEATAFVWRHLLGLLASRGIGTWAELRGWLAERPARRPRPSKPAYPVDRERYRSLPDAPGVYRFLRRNGDVLYVGKAASLRKRTTSHFMGRAGKLIAPEMLTQVSDIEVTVVASALEAALLENDTIKSLRPPYNVQLIDAEAPVWYASQDFHAAAVAPSAQHEIGPLPSAFSLRPLGALADLLAGKPADASTRAYAVGVSALWTPEQDVFMAGWRVLLARSAALTETLADEATPPRARALLFARHLLAEGETQIENESEAEQEGGADADAWDPERVARHLERAAAGSYRLYRRSRWLRLLHDADVVYREPEALAARQLILRDGAIVSAGEAPSTGELRSPSVASRVSAQRAGQVFDRARYDRLRILTTELKRILRDGGDVTLWIPGRAHPLSARVLRGVLRLV